MLWRVRYWAGVIFRLPFARRAEAGRVRLRMLIHNAAWDTAQRSSYELFLPSSEFLEHIRSGILHVSRDSWTLLPCTPEEWVARERLWLSVHKLRVQELRNQRCYMRERPRR